MSTFRDAIAEAIEAVDYFDPYKAADAVLAMSEMHEIRKTLDYPEDLPPHVREWVES